MAQLPPGYASVIMPLRREGDADPYAVTWAFKLNTSLWGGQDAADFVQDNFADIWKSSLPTGGQIGPAVLRIGQDGGDPTVFEASSADVGTNTGQFAPQNVALLIQKRSGLGGRKNRGRMYMPAITEGAVDNVGQIANATVAIYQGLCDDWLIAYEDPENPTPLGPWAILHNGPDTPTKVSGLRVDPVVATQRRRLRR